MSLEIQDTRISSKEIPNFFDLELCVLGSMMLNNDACDEIIDSLPENCFYMPMNARVYNAICSLRRRGLTAIPITVKAFLSDEKWTKEKGLDLQKILASMVERGEIIMEIAHLIKCLKDAFLRRSMIGIANKMIEEAYRNDLDKSAEDEVENSEMEIYHLATKHVQNGKKNADHLSDSVSSALYMMEDAYNKKGQLSGLTTGFRDLDGLLGGLQKSDLIILAGRPSMGKTALSVHIAMLLAESLEKEEDGGSVGFFSLEMSSSQIAFRMMAINSGISSYRMRCGKISESDFSTVCSGTKDLNKLPVYIDDTAAISISALRAKARRLKTKNNIKVLFVDYLQLITTNQKSGGNRVQEVSEITQGLKCIAKELDIPVVALSQLSRSVETREDKRPYLSDLRDSGSIEQDADIVMFIYREEYYHCRSKPDEHNAKYEKWMETLAMVEGKAEVIIAKQRNGPIGNVKLNFDADLTKFSSVDNSSNY